MRTTLARFMMKVADEDGLPADHKLRVSAKSYDNSRFKDFVGLLDKASQDLLDYCGPQVFERYSKCSLRDL